MSMSNSKTMLLVGAQNQGKGYMFISNTCTLYKKKNYISIKLKHQLAADKVSSFMKIMQNKISQKSHTHSRI